MKWLVAVTGALLVLAAASSATGQTRTDAGRKTQPTQNVFVINTSADPVPTSIVGTPSVSISGTPSVSVSGTPSVNVANTPTVNVVQTETPFQQFVLGSTTGGESCKSIVVPTGKRVTIESFSAEANTPAGDPAPQVYIRTDATTPNTSNFVRALSLDLKPALVTTYTGNVQTLLEGGAVDPTGYSFSFLACIDTSPGHNASYRGFVTGHLSPE